MKFYVCTVLTCFTIQTVNKSPGRWTPPPPGNHLLTHKPVPVVPTADFQIHHSLQSPRLFSLCYTTLTVYKAPLNKPRNLTTDHWPTCHTEVKNTWLYPSIPHMPLWQHSSTCVPKIQNLLQTKGKIIKASLFHTSLLPFNQLHDRHWKCIFSWHVK